MSFDPEVAPFTFVTFSTRSLRAFSLRTVSSFLSSCFWSFPSPLSSSSSSPSSSSSSSSSLSVNMPNFVIPSILSSAIFFSLSFLTRSSFPSISMTPTFAIMESTILLKFFARAALLLFITDRRVVITCVSVSLLFFFVFCPPIIENSIKASCVSTASTTLPEVAGSSTFVPLLGAPGCFTVSTLVAFCVLFCKV